MQEVVDYYVSNGSNVYTVLLDASKAFDRVNYVKLFNVLSVKGLCPLISLFLANMYTNQQLRVSWNGHYGKPFSISNGVKQGAILSPILFCLYMDVLINAIKDSGYGCYIGHRFVGCLGYADDLCILAPTCNAVKNMINICEKYSVEYKVNFNSDKSQMIIFPSRRGSNVNSEDVCIKLAGNKINILESSVHLGIVIGNVDNTSVSIGKCTGDMFHKTNRIMSNFSYCNSSIRNFLFRTYNTSYYGSPLWNLECKSMYQFYTSWRKCIRYIWKIPNNSHCNLLHHLYQGPKIDIQLLSRFLSFYSKLCNSSNDIVSVCTKLCRFSNTSAATNLRMLNSKLNFTYHNLSNVSISMLKSKLIQYMSDDAGKHASDCVRELCLVRDGVLVSGLGADMVQALLGELCVN